MLYDNEPESLSVECQLVRELDVLQHSFSSLRLEKKKRIKRREFHMIIICHRDLGREGEKEKTNSLLWNIIFIFGVY